MPFMDEPPGATISSMMIGSYGRLIRTLRGITNRIVNEEPKWRHRKPELTTGYHSQYYGNGDGEEWRTHSEDRHHVQATHQE